MDISRAFLDVSCGIEDHSSCDDHAFAFLLPPLFIRMFDIDILARKVATTTAASASERRARKKRYRLRAEKLPKRLGSFSYEAAVKFEATERKKKRKIEEDTGDKGNSGDGTATEHRELKGKGASLGG